LEAADVAGGKRCDEYFELIMAVETKYPGETRHQTALRYIAEAEHRIDGCACCECEGE
jgi:hypothetical protein